MYVVRSPGLHFNRLWNAELPVLKFLGGEFFHGLSVPISSTLRVDQESVLKVLMIVLLRLHPKSD